MSKTPTKYLLGNVDHMRTLGGELARLGFIEYLEGVDPEDGVSVYDALSDLDWYEAMWHERTVPFRKERGFHPVAGEAGHWHIYMMCDQNTVTLVETEEAGTHPDEDE